MKNERLMLKLLCGWRRRSTVASVSRGCPPRRRMRPSRWRDEGLTEWVDEHPFYGWHVTVEGHDRLAQVRR